MSKSVINEKPLAPADTEAKGKAVKTPLQDNRLWTQVCPCPATPDGAYISEKVEIYNGDLSVRFTDYNDAGEHPGRADSIQLLIDLNFNENATNRILSVISFYKWNGSEYAPVSLIGERPDLRHVVLGNIIEFDDDADSDNESLNRFLPGKEVSE
jgi:hypothetical protein